MAVRVYLIVLRWEYEPGHVLSLTSLDTPTSFVVDHRVCSGSSLGNRVLAYLLKMIGYEAVRFLCDLTARITSTAFGWSRESVKSQSSGFNPSHLVVSKSERLM